MAMRVAVLALAIAAVRGLHANPEDAVQKAIDQEMDMFSKDTRSYNTEGRVLTHNFLLKSSGLTVKQGEDGAPVCASDCKGDPSDLVHPFYRYNKDSKNPTTVDSFTVAKDTHFFNAADTAACVKDKYVLFLGDSTLGENVNDIEYLLAGGPHKVKAESFMWAVTTQTKAKLSWDTEKGTMTDTFDVRNRKHGIKFKTQNTDMKFYFTGATELSHNCDGISAMLDKQLRKRISEFTESTGRKPDAIVMNSGPHDACRAWIKKDNYTAFFENVDQVGREVIKPWVDQGIKVIFRGSYRFSGETAVRNPKFGDNRIPKEIDDAAQAMVEKYGATFVDSAAILANTHDSSGCCSTIRASTVAMPHLGSVALFKNQKASIFLSQLVTYKILDAICPGEI
jgi:hypothetical protein